MDVYVVNEFPKSGGSWVASLLCGALDLQYRGGHEYPGVIPYHMLFIFSSEYHDYLLSWRGIVNRIMRKGRGTVR